MSVVSFDVSPCLQETDPGKFTIAFNTWQDGLVWAVRVKHALTCEKYPDGIEDLPELQIGKDIAGTSVRRGVQPKARDPHAPGSGKLASVYP
jgi:hypothetical protein